MGAGRGGASSPPPPVGAGEVRALPKLDLHCHLDGTARTATLLELAEAAGHSLPADTVEDLERFVRVGPDCRSLRDFLAVFETFYPVLRQPGAAGRLARELLEDAAADGVVHLEVRFCPSLQAAEGHPAEAVLDEVLGALEDAVTPVSRGVVVCCYRALPVEENARLVELALRNVDRGVVAVDLAGPEDLPGRPLADVLRRAREGGLPLTVHAGEAAGPESVREAVDDLVATRLGHAVALRHDAELSARVRDAGIALECCLTSNLATGAVASLDEHPFDDLRRAGHLVTLNTDDPAVCATTLTQEYLRAARTWGLGMDELRALSAAAVEAAFVDEATRDRLRATVSASPSGP